MASPLAVFADGVQFTGNVQTDMHTLLMRHQRTTTIAHSERVANEALQQARRWNNDPVEASCAAWLHDISAIVPVAQRIPLAEALSIDILPEERALPMIIHQKLSVAIAQELFKITSPSMLSAIGCHTTLKRDASPLDKLLFVADKLRWDQLGEPPYLAALEEALTSSLDAAAWCYLDYLWQQRAHLRVLHPWAGEAYQQLSVTLGRSIA